MIITATFSFSSTYAALGRNTPDYFREFRIPVEVITDPIYERVQIVRTAEYVAYHSPFGIIIPVDLFLIAKHELEFLDSISVLHASDRR